MRVRVDGSEVGWDLSRFASLGSVLEEIYRKVAESGRVVGRVEIDGQELSTRAEREMAERSREGVSEIALSTGTSEELLREGVRGALSLAEAVCGDVRRAVEAFRDGDAARGQSLYAACVEAMETFFKLSGGILGGIRSGYFGVPMGDGTIDSAPSAESAEILARLLDHQKRRDWTAMADVLEYELAQNLGEWIGFLGSLPRGGTA